MGGVIQINRGKPADAPETQRVIDWLRKQLEQDQPAHRVSYINKRIAVLEERIAGKGPAK